LALTAPFWSAIRWVAWRFPALPSVFPQRVLGLVRGDTPFGFRTAALSAWASQMIEKIPAGFKVFEYLYAPAFV
jgi:hypothetical protein